MRQRGSGNVAATPDLVAERDGRVWSPDLCQITLWKIASATDRYDSGLASQPVLPIVVLDIAYQSQTPVPKFLIRPCRLNILKNCRYVMLC